MEYALARLRQPVAYPIVRVVEAGAIRLNHVCRSAKLPKDNAHSGRSGRLFQG
jgi:hypothetical protein